MFKRMVKRKLFDVGARLDSAFLAGLFVRGVNRGRVLRRHGRVRVC